MTRSPNMLSSAGSSVSAAATDTIPTTIAPSARLRITEVWTSSMPNIAITNVVPLNKTARLALALRALFGAGLRVDLTP